MNEKLANYITESFPGLTAKPGEGAVYIELNRTETDEGHVYDPTGLQGLEMIAHAAKGLRVNSGIGGPLYFVLEAEDGFIGELELYVDEFTVRTH